MPDTLIIEAHEPEQVARELTNVFEEVGAALEAANFTIAFTLISREIERFEETLFASEKAPDGSPWAPDAASTVKRKGHDVILHETGRLGASLFGQTGDSIRDINAEYLTFGTSVPYSIFLQEGTKRMPARPHVGLDEQTVDAITEYIADAAVVAVGGTL